MTEQLRHWTYHPTPSEGDLEQGDILRPTEMLNKIFAEVHPHFVNPKYFGFMVVTQSCDLVRRNGEGCSSPYISVAAIRLLDHVLLGLLDSVCTPILPGVYEEESRGQAVNLIHRLINQNEQALGLFYLHSDPTVGISEHAVALLRITVTLKSTHYDALRQARLGRLAEEFRAKLGWLVGNLYSRVGTQDWNEPKERADRVGDLVNRILAPPSKDSQPLWISRRQLKAARAAGVKVSELNPLNIAEELAKYKPPNKKEVAAAAGKEVLQRLLLEPRWLLDRFAHRLRADPATAPSADSTVELLKQILAEDTQLAELFFKRLRNDTVFSELFKN